LPLRYMYANSRKLMRRNYCTLPKTVTPERLKKKGGAELT
jgi:hypothetical protein